MANKSNKIILLITFSIFVALLTTFIQNDRKSKWIPVKGFQVKIKGEINQIKEFYNSLEVRLLDYPEWINFLTTGELNKFQMDYTPFRVSDQTFERYNLIFTSHDMTELLTEYSSHIENILLSDISTDSTLMKLEIKRSLQFCTLLYAHFLNDVTVIVSDIIDVMKYGVNPYYDAMEGSQAIYILLNKTIDSQLNVIQNQIAMELNELSNLINIDFSISEYEFQMTRSERASLLKNIEEYSSPQFVHIYKFLPLINSDIFNSRMSQYRKNIRNNEFQYSPKAADFLMALSKIEEQFIEFEMRDDSNISIQKLIKKLVGDGKAEFGILTATINLLDDRRYQHKVNDFLVQSSKHLRKDAIQLQELTYPTFHSLPSRIITQFSDSSNNIIYNLKKE